MPDIWYPLGSVKLRNEKGEEVACAEASIHSPIKVRDWNGVEILCTTSTPTMAPVVAYQYHQPDDTGSAPTAIMTDTGSARTIPTAPSIATSKRQRRRARKQLRDTQNQAMKTIINDIRPWPQLYKLDQVELPAVLRTDEDTPRDFTQKIRSILEQPLLSAAAREFIPSPACIGETKRLLASSKGTGHALEVICNTYHLDGTSMCVTGDWMDPMTLADGIGVSGVRAVFGQSEIGSLGCAGSVI